MYETNYIAQVLFKNGSVVEVYINVPDGDTPLDIWNNLPCDGLFKHTPLCMIRTDEVQAIVFKLREDVQDEGI